MLLLLLVELPHSSPLLPRANLATTSATTKKLLVDADGFFKDQMTAITTKNGIYLKAIKVDSESVVV